MSEIRWEIDTRAFWQAAIDADLGVSLTQIAASLGASPSSLSRLLNGKTQPSAELLARMRIAFGTNFDEIARAVPFEMSA